MSRIKEWKTTLIGLLTFLVAFSYLFFVENPQIWILIFLLGFGTMMLFSADSLISSISDFLKVNRKKKI
jgi:hypothetical protein